MRRPNDSHTYVFIKKQGHSRILKTCDNFLASLTIFGRARARQAPVTFGFPILNNFSKS